MSQLIILHGGTASCPHVDDLVAAGAGFCYVHASDNDDLALSQACSSEFGSPWFTQMHQYIQFGGVDNWLNLFKGVLNKSSMALSCDPPQRILTEALYHPDTGIAPTLADHLAQRHTRITDLQQAQMPVVGIWFYPGFYYDHNRTAQPEFDGVLISVPVATSEQQPPDARTGATLHTNQPIPERIAKLVRLAHNWARLRLKPNDQKRVAILLHNYPPKNEGIGSAFGLDSFASVITILRRLRTEGYLIERDYISGDDLAQEMLALATNDSRWRTSDDLAARAVARVTPDQASRWMAEVPAQRQAHMAAAWGSPPGELLVHAGQALITGVINGHVYIGLQPPRGFTQDASRIHDPHLAPPHHYLLTYRWIRDVFQADAVLHIGTHGTFEWMPGKALALSEACYPDLAIVWDAPTWQADCRRHHALAGTNLRSHARAA